MFVFQMIAKHAKEEKSLLASFETQILAYYGKDSNTPRVQYFLSWLKKNDKELTKQFYDDIKSGKIDLLHISPNDSRTMAFMVGAWLGGRYIEPVMGINAVRYPALRYTSEAIGCSQLMPSVDMGKDILSLLGSASDIEMFLAGVNIGLHEYAHAAPYMKGYCEWGMFTSELGVGFVQLALALPIKISSHLPSFASARNIKKDIDEVLRSHDSEQLDYIMQTNLTFASIPWIYGRLSKNFDLTDFAMIFPDRWDVKLCSLLEGDFNKYDFIEDCASKDEELIKDLLGAFSRIIAKARKIDLPNSPERDIEFLKIFSEEMTKRFGTTATGWVYPSSLYR